MRSVEWRDPLRLGFEAHVHRLSRRHPIRGNRFLDAVLVGPRAAERGQWPAFDQNSDGHRSGVLESRLGYGYLRGELETPIVLDPEAQLGVEECPAERAALGANIPDDIVVGQGVFHGHEGCEAPRFRPRRGGALRRRRKPPRPATAGGGQKQGDESDGDRPMHRKASIARRDRAMRDGLITTATGPGRTGVAPDPAASVMIPASQDSNLAGLDPIDEAMFLNQAIP